MSYPATDFASAVGLTITASNQLHEIVNGDAEGLISTDSGEIPSLRKVLKDNFYFAAPIDWVVGEDETSFNQLRKFTDGTIWSAPTATSGSPVEMTSDPYSNSAWEWSVFNAEGSEVVLQPRQTGDGVQTVFDAPNTEATTSANLFTVTKDGLKQRPDTDYQVTGVGEITFTEAPEEGVEVDILYIKAVLRELSLAADTNLTQGFVTPTGHPIERLGDSLGAIKDEVGGLTTSVEGVLNNAVLDNNYGNGEVVSSGSTKIRTLSDRFSDQVNVKDFGAVGDGVADDTDAIQAAIDSVSSPDRNGGTVHLPAGNYKVTSSLEITSVVSLKGDDNYAASYIEGVNRGTTLFSDIASPILDIQQDSLWLLSCIRFHSTNPDAEALVQTTDLYNGVTIDRCAFSGASHNIKINGGAIGRGLLITRSYLTGATISNIQSVASAATLGLVIKDCLADIGEEGFVTFSNTSSNISLYDTFLENLTGNLQQIFVGEGGGGPHELKVNNSSFYTDNVLDTLFRTTSGGTHPYIQLDNTSFTSDFIYRSSTSQVSDLPTPPNSYRGRIVAGFKGVSDKIIAKYNGETFAELGPRTATTRSITGEHGGIMRLWESSAVTIDRVEGGYSGQELKVVFESAGENITIDFTNGNLRGNKGINWTPKTYSMLRMTNVGTSSNNLWICELADR